MRSDSGKRVAKLSQEVHALRQQVDPIQGFSTPMVEAVLDFLDTGLFVLDVDFRIAWVSQAIERFFGLTRAELIGQDKRKLIQGRIQFLFEDARGFSERVLATYDDNTYVEHFECHVLPDAERRERWLEHDSWPIPAGFYAGGRIEVYHDITSRRGVEHALKSSEAQYRSLVEQIPAITYTATVNGITTYISPQIQEILGFSREEWLPDNTLWNQQLHPDDADRVRAEVAQARFGPDPIVREYRLLTADGRTRWFRDVSKLLRDELGTPLFFQGVLLDITDQKEAEAALRESEMRFRRLVDSNIIGIIVADIYGTILDANDAFLDMLGYRRSELPFSWDDMTPPEWRSLDEFAIEQLRWTGVATPWEKEFVRKDGRRVPVLIGISLLDEPTGNCICFVLDQTERRGSELALRRSERLASMGTLAAGIGHEINNPIGGILMAAQFALKFQEDPALVKKALDDIVENAARCGRIVKNVLKFAQDVPSERAPADLNQVVLEARDLIQQYAEKRGTRIELELADELPRVVINPTELEQVIINLVGNAVQAGAPNIVVRTEAAEKGVRLVIRDDGPGIPREEAALLFDPFYTTRQEKGGMGLGLSIVHGIVKDHDGEIDFESEPGKGTTMTIRLPPAPDDD